jgi:hypothetical protein
MDDQQEGETMTDHYLERLMARVRDAAGVAVDQALAAQPVGTIEDTIRAALYAGGEAAADVWVDAMLWGDYAPPPDRMAFGDYSPPLDTTVNPSVARELGMFGRPPAPPPSRVGAVQVAGGLLVNPADYREAR